VNRIPETGKTKFKTGKPAKEEFRMATFMSTVDIEKLKDLKQARRSAEHLSQYRQKYPVVPSIDSEEMLELYTAIERLWERGRKNV
jgi:hypothetical protein